MYNLTLLFKLSLIYIIRYFIICNLSSSFLSIKERKISRFILEVMTMHEFSYICKKWVIFLCKYIVGFWIFRIWLSLWMKLFFLLCSWQCVIFIVHTWSVRALFSTAEMRNAMSCMVHSNIRAWRDEQVRYSFSKES